MKIFLKIALLLYVPGSACALSIAPASAEQILCSRGVTTVAKIVDSRVYPCGLGARWCTVSHAAVTATIESIISDDHSGLNSGETVTASLAIVALRDNSGQTGWQKDAGAFGLAAGIQATDEMVSSELKGRRIFLTLRPMSVVSNSDNPLPKAGVAFEGSGYPLSDEAWVKTTLSHCSEIIKSGFARN